MEILEAWNRGAALGEKIGISRTLVKGRKAHGLSSAAEGF